VQELIQVLEHGKTVIVFNKIKFVLKKTTKDGTGLYYSKAKGVCTFRIVKISDAYFKENV
jgi:hypothetical protein